MAGSYLQNNPQYSSLAVSDQKEQGPINQGTVSSAAQAGAMSGGNPYVIGASFLLSYLNQKQQERMAREAKEAQLAQAENQSIQNLGSQYSRSLL